jgi:hypothetical protein
LKISSSRSFSLIRSRRARSASSPIKFSSQPSLNSSSKLWGYILRSVQCSILLYYPFKFKSRSFRPCLNPLLKEQASSRYELVGQRERGTSIYLCAVLM